METKTILFFFIIFIFISFDIVSQVKNKSSLIFEPVYKSSQLDFIIFPELIYCIGAEFDYDLLVNKYDSSEFSIGTRFGYEYSKFKRFVLDTGPSNFTTYSDINMLARLSTDLEKIRVDINLGGVYRKFQTNKLYKSGFVFKGGMDLKFKFYNNNLGLLIKAYLSSDGILNLGIGFYCGI